MNISAWKHFARHYRGSFGILATDVAVSIFQSLLVLPVALIVRHVFDRVIPARNLKLLLLYAGAMFLLQALSGGLMLWTRSVTLKTTKTAIRRFREELLDKLYSFSREFCSRWDLRGVHARIVQDTERLDIMSNALVAQFLPSLISSLGLCAVLIYLNWLLFVAVLVTVPALFVLNKKMGAAVNARVVRFHRAFEAFSKGVLFVLQMMDLTRIQSTEGEEIGRQKEVLDDLRLKSSAMAWIKAAYALTHDILFGFYGLLILAAGGALVITGRMSLGELLSYFVAVGLLRNSLKILATTVPEIIAGRESLDQLFIFLEVKDSRPYQGKKKIDLEGSIRLDAVTFRYDVKPVLLDVSLDISPGRRIAVAGPSGAGKTTLAHLILGFYRPQEGLLSADGRPYSDLDIVQLRRQIGVVTQDPIVFSGTIRENIAYGSSAATREKIVWASEIATAHEFIRDLPGGYDTPIGEEGMLLSGGQLQKIAFARALVREPRLLVLDEPTNNLDEATVKTFLRGLASLDRPPAVLIISHEREILREAEILHLLQDGRIIRTGPPANVLVEISSAQ